MCHYWPLQSEKNGQKIISYSDYQVGQTQDLYVVGVIVKNPITPYLQGISKSIAILNLKPPGYEIKEVASTTWNRVAQERSD